MNTRLVGTGLALLAALAACQRGADPTQAEAPHAGAAATACRAAGQ